MKKKQKNKSRELHEYDTYDTSEMIDGDKPMRFEELGLKLPEQAPTQVISIRLPSQLLNALRGYGSEHDVPYQALIKLILAEGIARRKKRAA